MCLIQSNSNSSYAIRYREENIFIANKAFSVAYGEYSFRGSIYPWKDVVYEYHPLGIKVTFKSKHQSVDGVVKVQGSQIQLQK